MVLGECPHCGAVICGFDHSAEEEALRVAEHAVECTGERDPDAEPTGLHVMDVPGGES